MPKLDEHVLNIYKWNDISLIYGFGLEYLEIDENLVPDELLDVVDNEDIFFNSRTDKLF